jgi:integrase
MDKPLPPFFGPALWPTATEEFLAYGRESNRFRSEQTCKTYGRCLKHLQDRYPGKRVGEVFTLENVLAFLTVDDRGQARRVGSKGWTEGTADTYVRAFRAFARFASKRGYAPDIREDLSDAFKIKVRTRREGHWLRAEDVAAVLAACPQTASGARDEAIITIGATTGLRLNELARLQWDQVHLRDGLVQVVGGKGEKSRYVGLFPRAADFLGEWKDRCATDLGAIPTTHPVVPTLRPPGAPGGWSADKSSLWWNRPSKLWVGQKNLPATPFRHCSESIIQLRVHESGARVGIPELAPHDLRRTYAGLLEDADIPIQRISEQLGHASVVTTQTYLNTRPAKQAAAMASVVVGF